MKNKRILFAAVCLLNLAAVACLVYFAVPLLAHDTFVPNPDAMIPMTRWEGCGTLLMLGLLPMAAANVLMGDGESNLFSVLVHAENRRGLREMILGKLFERRIDKLSDGWYCVYLRR